MHHKIPKVCIVKKEKTRVLLNSLIVIILLIVIANSATILKITKAIPVKTQRQVDSHLMSFTQVGQWIYSDIVCTIQKNAYFINNFTQVIQAISVKFSRWIMSSATDILQRKKLINSSKKLFKLEVFLLKYRFFEYRKLLEKYQARVTNITKLYQNKDSLSLVKGLVFGEKDNKALYYADFERAGMIHILVASGFNIVLVISLVGMFLSRLHQRKMKLFIIISIICLYSWFLEGNPPILRACLMSGLVLILIEGGKRINTWRLLILSALVLIFFSLDYLKSLSFWFSFLATAGLILFRQTYELFSPSSSKKSTSKWYMRLILFFIEEFKNSLAAQSLIFPLLVLFFHQINWLSFITNTLFLFPIAWFTQVGFVVFGLVALLKTTYFLVFLAPFILIYDSLLTFYMNSIGSLNFLFFLSQPVFSRENTWWLLMWLLVFSLFLFINRNKHHTKKLFFHETV